MNTIAFYISGFVLLLILLAKIPGLEHTVRPLIDLFFTLLKTFVENMWAWTIWLLKLLWGAHMELLNNLINSAEEVDPTLEMKNKEN